MMLQRATERTWMATPFAGHHAAIVWNEGGDGCYFGKFAAGATFPVHDHQGWEQILVLTGRMRFGDVEMGAGDTLLLVPGDVHGALALSDATVFVAHRGDITMLG